MHDRILVPLDGSSFSEQVLPLAALIARRSSMVMELVKVQRTRAVAYAPSSELAALDDRARERELAVDYLQRIARTVGESAGLAVRTAVLDGASAAEAICREAARAGSTLIAMTTHGRTGLLRAVRGSVADGVLHHTTLPVLLWRSSDPPTPAPTAVTHVLVALDGSAWAELVLPAAAALARALDARLTLLRVVANVVVVEPAPVATVSDAPFAGPTDLPPAIDRLATERAVGRAYGELEHVAERVRAANPGLVVRVRAVAGDAAAGAILRTADGTQADLVAMTTHARGASRLLVGAIVDRVLRGRTGATLLVRRAASAA